MNRKTNLDGLRELAAALSGKGRVQVGLFGRKNNRNGSGTTNAELGMVHELGSFSRHIPPRSFLRMPITRQTNEIMKDASSEIPNIWQKGGMLAFLTRVGHAAENAVQQAFASRGFGSWAPDKPATIARKGSDSPLIDTRQLSRAVASRAVL